MLCRNSVTPSQGRTYKRLNYPFVLVFRIRVLQVVCGILALLVGVVGYIQENGKLQIGLGLGMPAGVFTVFAAALSIHTSRGFSGYTKPTCAPPLSYLRFLGPSVMVGIPLTVLWLSSLILHFVIIITSMISLIYSTDKNIISGILLCIGIINIVASLAVISIDCRYDPD